MLRILHLEFNVALVSPDGALAVQPHFDILHVGSLDGEISVGVVSVQSAVQVADDVVEADLVGDAVRHLGLNFQSVGDGLGLVNVGHDHVPHDLLHQRQLQFHADSVVAVQVIDSQLADQSQRVEAALDVQSRPAIKKSN